MRPKICLPAVLKTGALVCLVSAVQPSYAQELKPAESPAVELCANIGVVSDYRFRGISSSDRNPAIQGGIDIMTRSGWFAGVWGSSIAPYGGAKTEVDFYVGYSTEIGGFDYSVAANAYIYPSGQGVNYGELQANVSKPIGSATVGAEVAYVLDQKNTGSDNVYLGMSLDIPFGETPFKFRTRGGYEDGFYDSKWDWEVGLVYEKDWGTLTISALGTDHSGAREAANLGKTGIVGTATLNF